MPTPTLFAGVSVPPGVLWKSGQGFSGHQKGGRGQGAKKLTGKNIFFLGSG